MKGDDASSRSTARVLITGFLALGVLLSLTVAATGSAAAVSPSDSVDDVATVTLDGGDSVSSQDEVDKCGEYELPGSGDGGTGGSC
jgi:hypothetical protein